MPFCCFQSSCLIRPFAPVLPICTGCLQFNTSLCVGAYERGRSVCPQRRLDLSSSELCSRDSRIVITTAWQVRRLDLSSETLCSHKSPVVATTACQVRRLNLSSIGLCSCKSPVVATTACQVRRLDLSSSELCSRNSPIVATTACQVRSRVHQTRRQRSVAQAVNKNSQDRSLRHRRLGILS